ncbi:MAG: SMC-Scp complex subunit ScpB [Candidatus Zixiibacteriota bacterium]
MHNRTRNSIVEALILASPEPLPVRRITEVFDDMTPSKVTQAVAELNNRYMESGSAFRIRELAGGYQFYIIPEFTGYVDELLTRRRKLRLTRAALETLAIVAYRQPVTRTDIEHIRGVASDGVVQNLLEKKLITIKGRANTVGRPLQYATTDEFLKLFGLNNLEDLPKMSEIEELISSREADAQNELELPLGNEDDPIRQKLNVADGTFDPDRVRETDEVEEDDLSPESPSETTQTSPDSTEDPTDNSIDTTPSPLDEETAVRSGSSGE